MIPIWPGHPSVGESCFDSKCWGIQQPKKPLKVGGMPPLPGFLNFPRKSRGKNSMPPWPFVP